jgi:hypothetical protein
MLPQYEHPVFQSGERQLLVQLALQTQTCDILSKEFNVIKWNQSMALRMHSKHSYNGKIQRDFKRIW